MVDDTRLELAGAGCCTSGVRGLPAACAAQIACGDEVTSSIPLFHKKQKTCNSNELQVYGGRYKTRTCDLPHVKRMRYQLRQSSSSLKQGVFYTIECKMSRIILHFSEKICTLAESRVKRQENGVCRKTDSVFC